jgi:hypothetical protein
MKRALFLAAVLAAAPSSAFAQQLELLKPAGRQGYYIGGGFRQAVLTMDADKVGNLGVMLGGGAAIRLGQMVDDFFGFGLAISMGGGSTSEWSGGYGALQLEGQIAPLDGEDLAVRLGVGLGALGIGRSDTAMETEDDPDGTFGTLYSLGVSYDLFPFYDAEKYETGGFAFTGYVDATLLPGGNVLIAGIFLGLEITYWFGFQQSRLELPPDAAFQKED